MPAKRRPPSWQRYAAAHPTIGVHVDRPTYARLLTLREESGLSFGYLVRRGLGVAEKEVTTAIARGFKKGRSAGYAEGKKAGHSEGWIAGREAGYAVGREAGRQEAESRYKIEYRCAACHLPMAVEKAHQPVVAVATAAIEGRRYVHAVCPRSVGRGRSPNSIGVTSSR